MLTNSTIALFVLALGAPRVDELFGDVEQRGPIAAEQRNPDPWPDPISGLDTARAWPGAFSRWFEDRVGLRDVLLRHKSLLYVQAFRTSPSDQVIIGTDNFLFYLGNHTIEIHRGVRPLSKVELDRFRRWFEYRDAWCRARGMQYLLVIGPNKETLYPELLPDWCAKLGPSRLDQFRTHLAATGSPVELVDLLEPLRAARALEGPRQRVYSVLGTHWDGLGMWTAYHTVAKRLARDFPAVRPLEWDEIGRNPINANPDSWARQMHIQEALDPFCTITFVPPESSRRTVLLKAQGSDTRGRTIVSDPSLPRLWVNHDSFGLIVLDLLTEHASNAVTEFAPRFDTESIEQSRANFVIDWFVERIFDYWTPTPDALPAIAAPKPQVPERVAWRLHPGEGGLESVRALGGARLQEVNASPLEIAIHLETTGDWVELPKIDIEGAGRPILRVSVVGPGATECDLFYRYPGAEYRRKNVCTATLPVGGSTIEFPLEREWLDAPLRLRPGRLPGTYIVSELSILLEEAASEGGAPPR